MHPNWNIAMRQRVHDHVLAVKTREVISHPSYRLVYEVDDQAVWILTLVHTARLWSPRRSEHKRGVD